MHDVVRDVGRSIAQRDRNMFIVKNDLALRDLAEKNTLKNCTSITLLDIAKFPGELDCPQLTFFYMKSKTRLHKVPDNFFKGMPNLEVLHLIDMVLSPLPASLGSLKKLRTLYLDWCHLEDIAGIKDMGNLEILVLSSNIKLLPKEIGQLTRLKVLKLSNCYDLKVIPPSTISRLTQLEELYLNYKFDNWHVEGLNTERKNASLDELEHLSQLTTLQIRIPDAKVVPKGLIFQKLQSYKIYIGVERLNCYSWYKTSRLLQLKYCYSWYKTDIADANISVDDGVIKQLKGIEELHLNGMQGVKNVLYKLNRDGFPKLKHFIVDRNPDLVYLVDFLKQSKPCVAFPHLETLSLKYLSSLEKIYHGQLTANSFCQLRIITVAGCVKLKNIFSSSIAIHLSQLQEISVNHCENMEEIFTTGRENEEIVWDKLHSLSLKKLPKLRSFYSEEEVASTSDQERQMIDTHMPLFDGKVKFRNLKTLQLSAINFEKMWHNQLPLKSSSFQNLTDLKIQNCCNMKYLFSSSTLGSFLQLQNLKIHNCTELEEIIRIDDLGIYVELPSWKELSIKGCPEMKAFIFSDKVTFPSLEEIQIQYMDNLEMIWNNRLEDFLDNQYCPKLCKVLVTNCRSLKNLFPVSIARNLSQLKDIYVEECGIKEIVSKEEGEVADRKLVFPKLTSLSLYHLQELKCFHPGIHTTNWPMLKKLNAIGCDKINALELFGIQEVISDDQLDILVQEKVLPNLEELGLDGIKTRMVWQRQFPEILFPKLTSLEILNDELAVFPPRILQRSHNLERLSLQDSSYEWIFSCEEVNEQAKIKSLHICKLHNLKQIWKQDSKVDAILQNLENLVVRSCGSLVTLIPPSTSFQNLTILRVYECSLINLLSSSTVKSLMQLKEMEIGYCKMMTEVVTGDEVGIEEEINFKNLKSLELTSLSRITRFCFGNYNFNFPSLEKFNVVSCPKMKIFSSIAASTPMLRGIELDWEIYYCDGDLNTTMERIHKKKNAESSTKDFAGPSAQHLE